MAQDKLQPWRIFVNSLDVPTDGEGPPLMEKILKPLPKPAPVPVDSDNVIMYKLTTTTYVYQHLGSEIWFGASNFQDVEILGEMTLQQARQLVNAKRIRRKKQ